MDIEKLRAETPGTAETTHLLAAGSSLPPDCVTNAVVDHLKLEARVGGYEAHAMKAAALDRVYNDVAQLIRADKTEIALMENATVAWCHAFYALPLSEGDRILTCEAEYAANYVAYLQRVKRDGIVIDVIPNDEVGAVDLDALTKMIDDKVKLISITWVPTNGGLVNPAAEVGKIAKQHGIPYLLDACQAVGQMPVDVDELGCDFLSATGRKFLRGPRGTGFLYIAQKWLTHLEPAMIDHFGAPWVDTNTYELRPDARRFETWENAYALRMGLGASARYANDLGLSAIQSRCLTLANYTRDALSELKGATLKDLGHTKCAIVSFTIDGIEPHLAVKKLRDSNICIGASDPSSTRLDSQARDLPTMLRASPHYFNTHDEIDRMVAALRDLT